MTNPSFFRKLRSDKRGVTIVEFALIFPIMATILMGAFDLGYQIFFRSVLADTLEKAARQGSIGNMTSAQLDQYITQQITSYIPASSRGQQGTVTVTKQSYSNFSRIGAPEKLLTDTTPLGQYNLGDCFEDTNGNGIYDSDGAGKTGTGGADDVVYYTVTVRFPHFFPVLGVLGWEGDQVTTAKTLVRNQPFANQSVPKVCTQA